MLLGLPQRVGAGESRGQQRIHQHQIHYRRHQRKDDLKNPNVGHRDEPEGTIARTKQRVGVFPGRGTRLEVEVDNRFQGVAEPEDQVGRGRHRGQIDVEQLHRHGRRLIERGQEALGAVPAHVF